MKFLVDNQLPPALARFLDATGLDALHVRDLAMDETSEHAIWANAKNHGYTIISKEDVRFQQEPLHAYRSFDH